MQINTNIMMDHSMVRSSLRMKNRSLKVDLKKTRVDVAALSNDF